MNHFEAEFSPAELDVIMGVEGGPADDLRAAYEDFAEKVRHGIAELYQGSLPDEDFFDKRPPIRTLVSITPAPRNDNWVKAYWVKAYGGGT